MTNIEILPLILHPQTKQDALIVFGVKIHLNTVIEECIFDCVINIDGFCIGQWWFTGIISDLLDMAILDQSVNNLWVTVVDPGMFIGVSHGWYWYP